MAVAFVQAAQNGSGVPVLTVSKAFTANNGGGNTLVAAVLWNDITTGDVTVTDSKGNVWIRGPATITNTTLSFSMWYMIGCAAGANTVTATWGLATTFPSILIAEYSGIGTFDVSATATGTGGLGTVNFTPAAAGETPIVGWGTVQGAAINAPYVQRIAQGVASSSLGDRIGAPAGAQSATANIAAGGGCCCVPEPWLGVVMAFKPAVAQASSALFFGTNA